MKRQHISWIVLIAGMMSGFLGRSAEVRAADHRLDFIDGSSALTVQELETRAEDVVVRLPRERVVAIDGAAPPAAPAGVAGVRTISLVGGNTFPGELLEGSTEKGVSIRIPLERLAALDGGPVPGLLRSGTQLPVLHATDLSGAARIVPVKGRMTVLYIWFAADPSGAKDVDLLKGLRTNEVDVVSLALDAEIDALKTHVAKQRITFPVIAAVQQTDLNVMSTYQVKRLPTTYVIGGHGMILAKFEGGLAEGNVDLGGFIDSTLKATQAGAPLAVPSARSEQSAQPQAGQ